jgi:hypothetical protein
MEEKNFPGRILIEPPMSINDKKYIRLKFNKAKEDNCDYVKSSYL